MKNEYKYINDIKARSIGDPGDIVNIVSKETGEVEARGEFKGLTLQDTVAHFGNGFTAPLALFTVRKVDADKLRKSEPPVSRRGGARRQEEVDADKDAALALELLYGLKTLRNTKAVQDFLKKL